jgi:hypothetical protein
MDYREGAKDAKLVFGKPVNLGKIPVVPECPMTPPELGNLSLIQLHRPAVNPAKVSFDDLA